MDQASFERALRAAFKAGYEEGFSDRDHSGDRASEESWAYWLSTDEGKAAVAQRTDESQGKDLAMVINTAPSTAVADLHALHATANEARALLEAIKGLEALPSGLRIDALRELSDAADDLAWSLVHAATKGPTP